MDYLFAERMLGALAVIALVLFALQFVARAGLRQRLMTGGERRLLTVLETTFLPNASSMHVVKVADRYMVVGRSGGHIATLGEIPAETIDAWLAAQAPSPLQPSSLVRFVARLRGRA